MWYSEGMAILKSNVSALDLIFRLQQLVVAHGDLPVWVGTTEKIYPTLYVEFEDKVENEGIQKFIIWNDE